MKVLVTGSAGHLGEALVRALRDLRYEVVGLDIAASPFTTETGSITDRSCVERCMGGVRGGVSCGHPAQAACRHAQPAGFRRHQHLGHAQPFGGSGKSGRQIVRLYEHDQRLRRRARAAGRRSGRLGDRRGRRRAQEHLRRHQGGGRGPLPVVQQEQRARLHRAQDLAFFPEEDDSKDVRETYSDENVKANEYLYRRVDIEDVVSAHLLAAEHAPAIGFRKYIISATTPFLPEDLVDLRADAPRAVGKRVPGYEAEYRRRGWKMFPSIERVYVNERARTELGWRPRHDFGSIIERLGRAAKSPVPWPGSSGRKVITPKRSPRGRIPSNEPLAAVGPKTPGGRRSGCIYSPGSGIRFVRAFGQRRAFGAPPRGWPAPSRICRYSRG